MPWDLDGADEWWTHHVDWEVFHEDDTHYCFRKIQNDDKAKLYLTLYKTQFEGDCSNMISKQMISSGWGADMSVVADGLMYAASVNVPVQMQKAKWHYATPKPYDDANPSACPTKDMFCYFLPLSSCPAVEDKHDTLFFRPDRSVSSELCCNEPDRWYLEFATRPQAWLRKRVYDLVRQQSAMMQTPCTVMHVRRADVVLHGDQSRRYHAISEYLDASDAIEHNVLLLTDDQNAVSEALHKHPSQTRPASTGFPIMAKATRLRSACRGNWTAPTNGGRITSIGKCSTRTIHTTASARSKTPPKPSCTASCTRRSSKATAPR